MIQDRDYFKEELIRRFEENGLSGLLDGERVEKFLTLTDIMLTENEKYNLTAITDTDKIILNHYADCATLCGKIREGASVIDVGCGAGFPTLPLAILRPDLHIFALDSTAKRIAYVQSTADKLGLTGVTARAIRAEEGGKSIELREKFDYATARAVAEMRILAELCLPFVKVGGYMVAMKGKNAEAELAAAKSAVAKLGGAPAICETVTIRGRDEELTHPLITVKKLKHTPPELPRPYARILKKPL